MARKIVSLLLSIMILTSLSCQAFALEEAAQRPEEDPAVMLPAHAYTLTGSVEVEGRQGVCAENGAYWVSGSASLAKYDKDWNLVLKNDDPFKGYDLEVNHIADIDVYENELVHRR